MPQKAHSQPCSVVCPLCHQGRVWITITETPDGSGLKYSVRHDCPACAAAADRVGDRLQARGGAEPSAQSLAGAEDRIRYFQEAVALCENKLGVDHPLRGDLLIGLGGERFSNGDLSGARQALQAALPFALNKGVELPSTSDLVARLLAVLEALGDMRAQADLLRRLCDQASRTVGVAHPVTLGWIVSLGHILLHLEDHRAAEACFQAGLDALDQLPPMNDDDPYGLYGKLPDLLTGLGPLQYHQALCREGLADAHCGLRHFQLARESYERALSIWMQDPQGILRDNFIAQIQAKLLSMKESPADRQPVE